LSDLDKFKFERPATQSRLITITIGKNKYPVIVSPGEVLRFTTDLMNNPEHYEVKGSDLSLALQDFQPIEQRKRAVEDSLQQNFIQQTVGKSDGEIDLLRTAYLSKYKAASQLYTKEAVAFAKSHPDLAGFYVMSTLDPELAEQELISYVDHIGDQFADNRTVI